MVAGAGLLATYGEIEASKAAAINQQTSYMLQARDTLAVAEVRADMAEQYSTIQAGRTIKKAELEAQIVAELARSNSNHGRRPTPTVLALRCTLAAGHQPELKQHSSKHIICRLSCRILLPCKQQQTWQARQAPTAFCRPMII